MCVEALYYCSMILFVNQPSSLDDSKLLGLGVLDSNHRRAILHKSGAGETLEDDFDNMLGDLSSVIKDLEMFSVVRCYSKDVHHSVNWCLK